MRAVLVVSQIAAKNMIARGVKGSIVNVSSQGSMVGLADHTSYCTSKGGLDQMTRVMAVELGPKGIRTNCVNPTVVMTAMGKKAWSDPVKAGPMLVRSFCMFLPSLTKIPQSVFSACSCNYLNQCTHPLMPLIMPVVCACECACSCNCKLLFLLLLR